MRIKPTKPNPTITLKPYRFPSGFILLQDTREQRPLFTPSTTPEGLTVITQTVRYGDYTIKGSEPAFAVYAMYSPDNRRYMKEHSI